MITNLLATLVKCGIIPFCVYSYHGGQTQKDLYKTKVCTPIPNQYQLLKEIYGKIINKSFSFIMQVEI